MGEVRRNGFKTGLCTGNFRESAFCQVEAAGLESVFTFGDSVVPISTENISPQKPAAILSMYMGRPQSFRFIAIGDTPNDLRSAACLGAVSVAVATGRYTCRLDELRPNCPDSGSE